MHIKLNFFFYKILLKNLQNVNQSLFICLILNAIRHEIHEFLQDLAECNVEFMIFLKVIGEDFFNI